ncbi:DUF1653 domain-containing protein [Micromonospora arida]|nr:DUF1653 domain-containing protein [Micromonospora arida]
MTESGIYRHYKGGLYEVFGVAEHTENGERFVVYTDALGRLWVRPQAMFDEVVKVAGLSQPRFRYLGRSGGDHVPS